MTRKIKCRYYIVDSSLILFAPENSLISRDLDFNCNY